ncbi:unnamed protein product [Allacma fusca]|uniref:Uncharacterized protein n=1 Tax=Allacma fusca TaxID=39272 RepID=A0A8J2PB85_9HEXA|nr:unnamed protein product [Allacma fusca]
MKIIGVSIFILVLLQISDGSSHNVWGLPNSDNPVNCTEELCHHILLRLMDYTDHPCVWPCEVRMVFMHDNFETMFDFTKNVRSLHQRERQRPKNRHEKKRHRERSGGTRHSKTAKNNSNV